MSDLVAIMTKLLKDSFGELFGGTPLPGTAMTGSDDWTAWVPSGGSVDLTDIAKAAIATVLREMITWEHVNPDGVRAFAAEHGIGIAIGEGKEGEKDD